MTSWETKISHLEGQVEGYVKKRKTIAILPSCPRQTRMASVMKDSTGKKSQDCFEIK